MDTPPPGFGLLNGSCVMQHEWFSALRQAGFSRMEALYIITRPSVEMTRLQWAAENPEGSPA